ncbi:MAG: type II toxin-antitoxin system PemK/MazF family toxin [Pseudonocardia sp.]
MTTWFIIVSRPVDRASKARAEQVRSVSASRIGRRIGALSTDLVTALDDALRLHLGL